MGNALVFSSISHNFGKVSENHRNWFPYFFHKMGAFFPLYSHPVVYFIIWEMHGFSHQSPMAWEMHGFSHQSPMAWEIAGKPIEWEKPMKLVSG